MKPSINVKKEHGFNGWEAKGKIELPVNRLQAESIVKLNDTVWGMHYANIIVRKNGQDVPFEADWLKKVIPLLEPVISDEQE